MSVGAFWWQPLMLKRAKANADTSITNWDFSWFFLVFGIKLPRIV
jgi:hypothetical protein